MSGRATAPRVAASVHERTARGIAAAVSRMVSHGEVAPGDRLPTVRELAGELGTSPTTVSEAWRQLARVGVIESRGRAGTFVAGRTHHGGPRRYRRMAEHPPPFRLDLSTGTPDPALLPDLHGPLSRVQRSVLTTSYLDRPVLPELERRLVEALPFRPEALTVVDGALDGLDRVATLAVRLGDRVLVENPAFPPTLDLLDLLGAEVVPLALDDEGIVVSELVAALALGPVALFLQPRSHNPTGISMSVGRARALAKVLKGHDVLVVEDDHSGAISSSPDVSLGAWLPGQTVHITSFSKSHGPDLRLASVAGPADVVDELVDRRTLGPGWSSRILQAVLVDLLTDQAALGAVERARDVYADRRRRVTAGLDRLGIAYTGYDGINLWVATPDEQATLVGLAAQGIAGAPGSPFVVAPDGTDHVRLTVGVVVDDHARLASQIADAVPGAAPGRPRRAARTVR